VRVLTDPTHEVLDFHDRHARLAERLQLDFSDILFLLDHMPLALRGEAHVAQRADAARLLGERRGAIAAAAPGLIAKHFACLEQPGAVDLLNAAIIPLVEELIAVIVDADLSQAEAKYVSRVFSQLLGVAQRRLMNEELAVLRRQIALAHPDDAELRQGSRLAVVVLGRDAMIGTLAGSLHAHFEDLAGDPLNSRALPDAPTHSGVPAVPRESKVEGEELRCRLQSFEGAAPAERMRFFGAGSHVCLGRALSLDLFKLLSAHLLRLGTVVTVDTFVLRKDDVFAMPSVFTIKVTS
jgi:hypothetical protein